MLNVNIYKYIYKNVYAKSGYTNDFMHLNALAALKHFQNQYIG